MSFDLRFSQVDLDVLMFEPGGTIDHGRLAWIPERTCKWLELHFSKTAEYGVTLQHSSVTILVADS